MNVVRDTPVNLHKALMHLLGVALHMFGLTIKCVELSYVIQSNREPKLVDFLPTSISLEITVQADAVEHVDTQRERKT